MKKRKILLSVLALVLVTVLCAAIFVACDPRHPDPEAYTITFVDGNPATVEVTAGEALTAAQIPAYTGTAPAGKAFDHWAVAGADDAPTDVRVEAGYTPEADVKAVAVFRDDTPQPPTTYTITFVDGDPGTVTVTAGQSLTAEQIPTYTGTVPADQEFEQWVVAGENDAPTSTVVGVGYTPTASVRAVATFRTATPQPPTTYTITFVDGDPGTVTVTAGQSLTAEQIPTYTGTVPADQEFEQWVVAGENDAPTSTVVGVGYTPTASVRAVATFRTATPQPPTTYTITFVDGDPGTVTVTAGQSLTAEQIPTYTGTVPADQEFEQWVVAGEDDAPTSTVVGVGYTPTASVRAVATFKALPATADDFVGVWADDVNHVMISITKGVNGNFAFAGFVDQTDVSVTEGDAYDASANKFTLKNGDIVDTPTKTYEFTVEGDNVTLVFHDSSNLDAIQEKTYTLGRRTGGNFVGAYAYSPAYKIEIVAGDYVLGYNYPYARVIEQEGVKKLEYLRTSGLDYDDFAVVGEGLVIDDQPYVKNGTYVDSKSQAETYEASIRIYTVDSAKYYVLSYGDQFYFNVQLDVEIAANATVTITYGDSQTLKVKFDDSAAYFTILYTFTGADGGIEYDGENYTLSDETLTVNPLDDTLVYSTTKAYKLDRVQSTYVEATADKFANAEFGVYGLEAEYPDCTFTMVLDGYGRISLSIYDEQQITKTGFYLYDAEGNTIRFSGASYYLYSEGPYAIKENDNVFVASDCVLVKDGYEIEDQTEGFYGYWEDDNGHWLDIGYEEHTHAIYVDDSQFPSTLFEMIPNYNGSILTTRESFQDDDVYYARIYIELTLEEASQTLTYKVYNLYTSDCLDTIAYHYVSEFAPGFESDMLGDWISGDGSLTINIEKEQVTVNQTTVQLADVQKAESWFGYTYTFTADEQVYTIEMNGILMVTIGEDFYAPITFCYSAETQTIDGAFIGTFTGSDDAHNPITLEITETEVKLNNVVASRFGFGVDGYLYFYVSNVTCLDITGESADFNFMLPTEGGSPSVSCLQTMMAADLTSSSEEEGDGNTIYGTWTCGIYTITITFDDSLTTVVADGGTPIEEYAYSYEDNGYYAGTLTIVYDAATDKLTVTDSNDGEYSGTYTRSTSSTGSEGEIADDDPILGEWIAGRDCTYGYNLTFNQNGTVQDDQGHSGTFKMVDKDSYTAELWDETLTITISGNTMNITGSDSYSGTYTKSGAEETEGDHSFPIDQIIVGTWIGNDDDTKILIFAADGTVKFSSTGVGGDFHEGTFYRVEEGSIYRYHCEGVWDESFDIEVAVNGESLTMSNSSFPSWEGTYNKQA